MQKHWIQNSIVNWLWNCKKYCAWFARTYTSLYTMWTLYTYPYLWSMVHDMMFEYDDNLSPCAAFLHTYQTYIHIGIHLCIFRIHKLKSVYGTFEKRSYLSSAPQENKNFVPFYSHGDCLLLHFVSHSKCFLRFPSYIRSFLFCSVWKITLASSFSYLICLYSFSLPLCLLFLWQFTRVKCVNIYIQKHIHTKHTFIFKKWVRSCEFTRHREKKSNLSTNQNTCFYFINASK